MSNFLILIDEERTKTDEGIYNFAVNLSKAGNWFFLADNIKRKFIFFSLLRNVRKYNPDHIIYIPTASLTIISFLRATVIKKLTARRIFLIGLQPRSYNKLIEKSLSLLKPDFLFVQIKEELNFFRKNGFKVSMIPSGVNLDKFHPVNEKEKNRQS